MSLELCRIMTEKQPNVRRCLFGRPDRDKLDCDLKKQDQMYSNEGVKRLRDLYGFDPLTDQPVDGGQYICTALDPNKDSVPSFYLKTYPPRKLRPASKMRERLTFCRRPLQSDPTGKGSAKRKLCYDDSNANKSNELEINDENRKIAENRVPSRESCAFDSALQQLGLSSSSSSSSPLSDASDCGRPGLFDSNSCGLAASLPELSASSRNTDMSTPPTMSRSVTQSLVTDFWKPKKCRPNTKALPRT